MDDDLRLLERIYSPVVDSDVVRVIWGDFAHEQNGVGLARAVLDTIYQAALAGQATDFDASGSSGDGVCTSSSPRASSAEGDASSSANTDEWVSQSTDDTLESACFQESEHLDTPTKEMLLAETFPTLRVDFVARILRKCGDNLSQATDELLNHVYLGDAAARPRDEPAVPRGIDAFSEEHHVPMRKRGKGKKKHGGLRSEPRRASASEPAAGPPPETENKWQHGNQQVDFVAARTQLPRSAVASLYHRHGGSLSATVLALADAHKTAEEPDAALVDAALDLVADFTSLDPELAVALLRLTSGSPAHARDLAESLTAAKTAAAAGSLVPRYAPIRLSEPAPASAHSPALPPSAFPQTSASLSAARSAAFEQASAAFRRGRSAPLMKAAAGYYSQVARDLNANLKVMTERDADALVASQSTPTCLDLHGVTVQSATRIAKEKTQAWWRGLGEARIPGGGRTGAGEGFRIITGLGRHSEGGRGKIGPAVVRMLVKEGWKVTVGTGELHVMGLARRK